MMEGQKEQKKNDSEVRNVCVFSDLLGSTLHRYRYECLLSSALPLSINQYMYTAIRFRQVR